MRANVSRPEKWSAMKPSQARITTSHSSSITELRSPWSIRQLTEGDVAGVADLFERVYPQQRWQSREQCETYFRRIFFANPWRHLELPSWIAVEAGGVAGFAGVLPRPMMYGSRPVSVAVGSQFMVHPERRRTLIALELVKRILSGPQDLFVTDASSDEAKSAWLGVGGVVPILQNLHWTRVLRPMRYTIDLLEKNRRLRPLAGAARLPGALVDSLAARLHPNRFARGDRVTRLEPLDAAGMLDAIPELVESNRALRAHYDERSLTWLLEEAARKSRHGALRARAVVDTTRLLGWFIYYARAGAINEVLQLTAREDSFDVVLRRLLIDAWEQGATAVRGRVEPRFAPQLSDQHCWFRREGGWTLVHSRDDELLESIERGSASIGRLDGQWWLRFHDR